MNPIFFQLAEKAVRALVRIAAALEAQNAAYERRSRQPQPPAAEGE